MAIKLKKIKFKKIDFKNLKLPFGNKGAKSLASEINRDDAFAMHSKEIANNPYLQSRTLWMDIHGSAEERYNKSRKLNFILAGLVAVSILGVIHIGSQSKLIPYVVHEKSGQIIYSGIANHSNFDELKPQLSTYFIQEFIKSARSVSVDGYMARSMQTKAFALTEESATTELDTYFKKHDPYKIVKNRTIHVEISYVNKLPNDAFQVGWTEISRDSQSGQTIGSRNFVGEFNFKWEKPSQSEFILQNNPFGFYVTNISWTGVK